MPPLEDNQTGSLIGGLLRDLRPERLVPALLGGVVVGVLVVILAISFSLLVFSDALTPFSARGIGLGLYAAVVFTGLIAFTSSFASMIAIPQEVPAAITALVAAAAVAAVPASAPPETVFATIVAAVALTTIAAGVFFLALGLFKLGGLVRFIPYPVIGGFLAGTGWLLLTGAFGVLADAPLAWSNLGRLLQPDSIWRWLPGVVFGVAILVAMRRARHLLVLPGMLLGGVGVFYASLLVTGTSLAEATARGWLMAPFPSAELWRPIGSDLLSNVHWAAVWSQARGMLAAPVVGVVALLLNASGLELVVRRDIDLDRELRSAGVANLVSGLGGGLAGFQTLSISALSDSMVPASRLLGLVAAAVCAASLVFGSALLSLFPLPVLGGLLLFLGLSFLVEWVYDAWDKLPRVDYVVVLLILLVIATVGFLESVGVGIVIAVVMFVVNYSRIDVVKHALSGASHHSNVQRPRAHTQALRDTGDRIFILQLQGFVFFGTANNLLQRVRARIENPGLPSVHYVVLDFRLVSGIDSSAVLSFVKMRQLGEGQGWTLVFADAADDIHVQLDKEFSEVEGVTVQWFTELDRAVEWSEDQILLDQGLSLDDDAGPLEEQLAEMLTGSVDPAKLMPYLERQKVPARHYLMRQGGLAEDLFFVESGQVTAQLEFEDHQPVRLLTMGAGTVVGEMEVYLERPRAASVITEQPSVVYRLSVDDLARMEKDEPELAVAFHKFVARLTADRVTANHKTLEALLR